MWLWTTLNKLLVFIRFMFIDWLMSRFGKKNRAFWDSTEAAQKYISLFACQSREPVRLCVCAKGDVAVSPVVTVTSGRPTCHIAAPPPTLLTERNTQCYYYHWQETCWTTPAIWADSHSVSLCLCLWLISSFLLFGWCSYPFSFLPQ